MKRVIWLIMVVASTLVVLLVVWQFSLSIVLFALSLAVAAALRPLINDLGMRIRSKRLALTSVYAAVILSIVALLAVGGQFLLRDLQTATDDFATNYERIKNDWPQANSLFQQTLAEQLPSADDLYRAITSEQGIITLTSSGGPGSNIFSILGYIGLILVLSIYWSADQLRFERLSVSLFPTEHRPKALHVWRAIESGVGAYMRSEAVQSVVAGLLLWAGYSVIGVRYPALLATWGALIRLVPWFGILIAIIPLVLIAVSGAPLTGVLSILFTIIVLLFLRKAIEKEFLEYQHSNSLLFVLFVILLAEAFGFMGLLLAPPLAVSIQILLKELYPILTLRNSQELQRALELKKRLSQVRRSLRYSDSKESMRYVNQLYQLVRHTISYMQRY